ncbi:MAG: Calx-beta domain-containing protein [Isosphaeraceae bacterium]
MLESLETRQLLSTYRVTNTSDDPTALGTLRDAITAVNNDPNPGSDNIEFDIPASTSADLATPVPGFDPTTQTWRITLNSQLPNITHPVTIDGYSEARVGVPFRYPTQSGLAVQSLSLVGSPTGGTFTLTTQDSIMSPGGTTVPLPWNATAAQVQSALWTILGAGNATVTGGPLPDNQMMITFGGPYARQLLLGLKSTNDNLTGGTAPGVSLQMTAVGGTAETTPTYIQSSPNSTPALDGDNARDRVIIDGSGIAGNKLTNGSVGFVLDASHSILRGLDIINFGVGVTVPALDTSNSPVVGTLIQGNNIGDYYYYPVDQITGQPLPSPNTDGFTSGQGNGLQGVVLYSSNCTVGGSNPQECNIIDGNGAQGILAEPGASGNQILGNQIGVAGPSDSGVYAKDGNGAEGVLILSAGSLSNPLGITYSSSNFVGSATGGNVISANGGAGVRIVGVGANRNLVQGNYIGVAPGGGYPFGSGDPGNLGDGVRIEGGSQNQIGGDASDLGNTISTNGGAGVYITAITDQVTGNPDQATNNVVSYNLIGTTSSGEQILGNSSDGVSIYSPSNTVGPGNVISGNLRGIGIYGPGASTPGAATDIMVFNNLIGTDQTGKQGFGNAYEGIRIDGSSANTIQGDAAGSQVISGNQVGVGIYGSQATQNLVIGNLIGSDVTGLLDLGNKNQGVLISGALNNTIGGSLGSSRNLISANHWGVQLDGAGATGNTIEGNEIGTDITGAAPLGNEVEGVIFSNGASNNTIGGVAAGLGNIIAFHVRSGVLVESGTGDSILSNSIFANGRIGIDLVAAGDPADGVTPNAPGTRVGPNDLQNYPVISQVTSNGTLTDVSGSLNSLPNTTYLIQFFTNLTADPSGYGQGQTGFGSYQVTTDSSGNATFTVPFAAAFPSGAVLSATATELVGASLTPGDTSEFSRDVPESSTFQFSAASYITTEASGAATITVTRSLTSTTTSVYYSTAAGGTATPGSDYVPIAPPQLLTFAPGVASMTFTVQILDPHLIGGSKTVNLALSNPSPAGVAAIDFQTTAVLRINDNDSGASGSFVVTNTNDSGPGSLRQAILNADAASFPSEIIFDIPAATDNLLSVPYETIDPSRGKTPIQDFDPVTQTWTINPLTPLPVISQTVTIDGFTQAATGVPFRYPSQVSSNVQSVTITGAPTGGTFTLSTSGSPLPPGTTGPIAYNATPAQVQAALVSIPGMIGNVAVTGSVGAYTIAFQGAFAGQSLPKLTANASGLTGTTPGVLVAIVNLGGLPVSSPTLIKSVPNSTAAKNGNNAQIRVIIEGNQTVGGTGLVVEASHCVISGLIIDGFDIGVSVPLTTDVGNLIQGNYIGNYLMYPVDATTGTSLTESSSAYLAGLGNTQQGVYINANNTTVGGTNPQENNVIAGNGAEGVWIDTGGTGNVVEGNQIGMVGPSTNGLYFQVGNGADGVLVDGSSNIVGGPSDAAANVISGNGGNGVRIVGPVATRTVVAGNLIGLAPGGGYLFGTGNPGNGSSGVEIDNSAQNEVGGPSSSWGNVISSNAGAGVLITGITSTTNTVAYNLIGTTASGSAVKGNLQDGVAVFSPQNTIGPGNVISGNLRGVDIEGANASATLVQGNLIGTDLTGEIDLGNAQVGVLIQNATDAVIEGDGKGSQVISGNLQGVVISGASATRNLIEGNLIGTDKTGQSAMPNAQEGVDIESAPGNTIGGTTSAAQNLISANHWGVRLDGGSDTLNIPMFNLVEGNLIGTDITGKVPLGNEVNGVIVSTGASNNTIGGTAAGAGNTIDFNVQAGVAVQPGAGNSNSVGNSILSNSINSNGKLGIDLVASGDPPNGVTPDAPGIRSGPNDLQNHPILQTAIGGGSISSIQGTLNSLPNTTFVVQFFTNTVPDPSGYGQGQTLIGSTSVTTDGSGNATISYAPGTVLSPNAWISATATVILNPATMTTGDTSEFSNSVSAQPVSVQFATSTINVDATAGTVLVDVQRVGNTNAKVSVNYATGGGTAVAGKDYTTATGTLTFQPGQTDQTFPITILSNPSQLSSSVTANMTLSQPTGGATLGTISTATLTIDNNLPPILQFNSASYSVSATASSALVTVVRGGGDLGTTVQVGYTTLGGTAVPGTTYTPVSGTLTFLPNQTTASFSVPIIPSTSATTVQTVGLALFGPTAGAELGAISSAPLMIVPGSSNNPSGPVDHVSPVVTGQQLIVGPGGITGVVFSFSKPMDPTRAADLGNYGYFARIAGPDGLFSNPDDGYVALSSASYNSASASVTVIPKSPLPLGTFVQITLDGLATPLLNRGLADTSGNLLAGQSGVPGSPYVVTFGVGTQLHYADSHGKSVSLSLSGGGEVEIFRGPTGDVLSASLIGTVPRRSVLTLTASGGNASTTYLPPFQNASGVTFRYKPSAAAFRSQPQQPAPTVVHHAAKPLRVVRPAVRRKK